MSEWNSVGVRRIDQARDWRLVQISATEAKDWIEVGVTSPAIVRQWKSLGQLPEVAHNWKERDLGPDDFVRLNGSLPSRTGASQWIPIPPPPLTPYRQLTPASLPSQIIQNSGLHTLSSVSSRSDPSHQTFDNWLANGRHHIDAIGGRKLIGDEFLRFIFSRDLRWSEPSNNPFLFSPDRKWLEEIQHRAELLRERIRITVSQPALFDGGGVQIALITRGNDAFAWVGQSSLGLLTAFSLPNCRPKTSTNQASHRAAIGLGIAWFLDVSVSLRTSSRSGREHPHFTSRSADSSPEVAHVRYVPTPRFDEHRRSVSRGSYTPRPTHQVEGHVRTLPRGWEPTNEARSNAPGYMDLGPNETFVRAHVRGIEVAADEMTRHLSKYSVLAEALGTGC